MIFLPNLAGSLVAATTNPSIHHAFGQRGVAVIAPSCMILSYVVISTHPPFAVVVFFLAIVGFAVAIQDSAWNAFIGDMSSANQALGFLHGLYGFGAILGPLIVSLLVAKFEMPWWSFYYFMVSTPAPC